MHPAGQVWQEVCHLEDLVPGSGVALLLEEEGVALYYLPEHSPSVYALAHQDPFSGAEVLAYGLLCERDGRWSVAAPLYKQHFDLETGVCWEDESVSVRTWPVRIQGERVWLAI
ncbi:nitrite reductase small subunit NirD [Nitrincola tapanii]|uniref:Nitrite reductase small subunit NirD n=2 Tax=Nitrincola tapanii TaxID=1708751 RepID=A0A5A9WB39_9GAMM|nr:nitrite reductase small subunit NirD [Nitrincola tapanii]